MLEFRNKEDAQINSIYRPADKVKDDRENVYKRYFEMRQNRKNFQGQDLESKWDDYEKQYKARRPNRSADDWQSNITPPFTTALIEKALAEIVDQVLRPKIVPRGPEDADKAKLLNHIMDYTWDIGDADLELYHAIKQALIYGKTIWQEDYFVDKRDVKILKKYNPETGEEEYVEKEFYDFDDVYGEHVPLHDFFIDPDARTINRGKYKANDCVRRYIMDYNTFMERFKDSQFDQFGHTKYVRPGGDTNYYQFYKPPKSQNTENLVEVLFYWGRRPDKLIIVANDVVIRDGPNPYNHKQLPFAEGSDIPDPDNFYAMGESRLLESIQDELNTLRRMRIDRQHMDIWKMFLVSNRETLDEDEAIVAPSRFMYVEDPKNSIVPLEYGDINPSAYREEELLKQDGREVTGVLSPQPTSTATEAAIHKEATMRALRLKIWLFSRELVTGITKLRVPNIVQYYSVPKVEEIGGELVERYKTVRTEDVKVEFTPKGEVVEKEEKGTNFFVVKPEMIRPKYGGYDLKLSAEPSLPVSKPLLQQKTNDLMQHPVISAAIQSGHFDLGKTADLMMDVNEYDPEKLKIKERKPQDMIDKEQLLELANRENQMLMDGKRVPATPYATRDHTNLHLAFMESEEFKAEVSREIIENFVYHVMGEDKAQQAREKGRQNMFNKPGGPAQPPGSPPRAGRPGAQGGQGEGVMGGDAKAAQPGRMQGGEGVPNII